MDWNEVMTPNPGEADEKAAEKYAYSYSLDRVTHEIIKNAFIAGRESGSAHHKAQTEGLVKEVEWVLENCEFLTYEPVGGDGAPTGYLPFPFEPVALRKALADWRGE
jgi:hypothetical protein